MISDDRFSDEYDFYLFFLPDYTFVELFTSALKQKAIIFQEGNKESLEIAHEIMSSYKLLESSI